MPKRKYHLLLVDDDVQCLEVRRILFEAFDFEVTTASMPRQGLKLFHARLFDAVVVDFQMPEMNGAELTREMKFARPTVPVVVLSGLPELPEGTPEFHDRFLCKADSAFQIVKVVESLILSGGDSDDDHAKKVGWPARLLTAAGVVIGFASESASGVRHKISPARKPTHDRAARAYRVASQVG